MNSFYILGLYEVLFFVNLLLILYCLSFIIVAQIVHFNNVSLKIIDYMKDSVILFYLLCMIKEK